MGNGITKTTELRFYPDPETPVDFAHIRVLVPIYLDSEKGWYPIELEEDSPKLEPCELKIDYVYFSSNGPGFNYKVIDREEEGPEFTEDDLVRLFKRKIIQAPKLGKSLPPAPIEIPFTQAHYDILLAMIERRIENNSETSGEFAEADFSVAHEYVGQLDLAKTGRYFFAVVGPYQLMINIHQDRVDLEWIPYLYVALAQNDPIWGEWGKVNDDYNTSEYPGYDQLEDKATDITHEDQSLISHKEKAFTINR